MEKNVLQQKCLPHKQEAIAFDLDPLAEIQDRYLCDDCLISKSQTYQKRIKKNYAQEKFKEMINFEHNKKQKHITNNKEKLQNLENQIKEFQELFNSRMSESIKILKQKIQEIQNELNSHIQPKQEMQTEQDLINLSNYVNYGQTKNFNQMNSKFEEFIDKIYKQLDNLVFEEHLQNIFNSLEQFKTQGLIEEQAVLIPQNQLYKDQEEQKNLRYKCQKHDYEISMIYLEPGQVEQRLFCQKCISERGLNKLKTIQDVNSTWLTHLKNSLVSNKNFYDSRQDNQNKINELIIQHQKQNSLLFNELKKQIINQNNKIIKDRNDSQASILNKQLYQMQFKEIELVVQKLSQEEPMQDVLQKQLFIYNSDKQYKDQILEQLNLSRKKLMETQLNVCQLFSLRNFVKEMNKDQIYLSFMKVFLAQFNNKYSQWQEQLKSFFNLIESQQAKLVNININPEQNNQQESKFSKYQKILSQIKQIEKIQLSQINLEIQDHHINEKYKIKYHPQLTINRIIDQSQIKNIWTFNKKVRFSNILKQSSILLTSNNKLASNQTRQKEFINLRQSLKLTFHNYCASLFDEPIPSQGIFSVDFRINKLFNIMIGICNRNLIKQDFQFDNYQQIGHGFYVLENSGCLFSHHDSQKNQQKLGFQFHEGDVINIEVNFNTSQIIWRNIVTEACDLEFQPSDDLHFCCAIYQNDIKINEVEII